MAERHGPLAGLRVVEAGTIVSAPLTACLLGDLGAHVIKIELPKTGDPLRAWLPVKEGVSLWWKVTNRNKQLITLDLSRERGRQLFLELVRRADVVVENFRPGTMERWGLGYEQLSEVNPRIVMVRISGYGQDGPYRNRPGFGTIAEALSGVPYFTGFPDKPPTFSAWPMADGIAAVFAALGVMSAVYERDVGGSGRGQVVDVSLYEPLFRLVESQVIGYDQMGLVKQRRGNLIEEDCPRNAYRTADGEWVAISASSPRVFERLCRAIGQPELASDPRFKDNKSRVAHREEIDGILVNWFGQRSLAEAMAAMERFDVVAGPVYDVRRIFDDPHYAAREDIVSMPDPDFGQVRMQGVVPRFSRTPGRVVHPGLSLGHHNREVYCGLLGLSEEELAELQDQGVV